MIVRAIAGNLNLFVTEPSATPVIDTHICFAAMVPLQVHALVESDEGMKSIQKIETLIIGGSFISQQLEKKLQTLSTACYATFGMTESVSHIALRCINGANKASCYTALKGIWFETDERQCLVIHAPHLQEKPFITNDIVIRKSSTSFEWMGRYDNVINTGGIKIFPENVEKKIESFISQRFFISSLPDEKLGQQVILVIESTPFSFSEMTVLEQKLWTELSAFEKPRRIIFTPKFSETYTGKVKRIIPSSEY
jgi:O-succinylbenzoic acid--CoA ligase